jgi:hypothetical protein
MTIKIKAPVSWLPEEVANTYVCQRANDDCKKYRIVSESDWRKLVALVKAVDTYVHTDSSEPCWDAVVDALAAVRKKK